MQEPEPEWIVREERVATQAPEYPTKDVADNVTDTSEASATTETTQVGSGLVTPGLAAVAAGQVPAGPQAPSGPQVSSAQSVVRRVPSYDYRMVKVVRYATGVLEVLLIIRFFLRLLGASPEAAFTALVYVLTYVFVVPFQGIFAGPAQGPYVFDSSTLVAIIVYPLVGWALVGLIKIKTARRGPWKEAADR